MVVKFVVEKDGSIGQATIAKGVDKDLDREALRVVKKMPKWQRARTMVLPFVLTSTSPSPSNSRTSNLKEVLTSKLNIIKEALPKSLFYFTLIR